MSEIIIRPIQQEDSSGVAKLIRSVMPEFGATGPGYAIDDPEVGDMFVNYNRTGHVYFVITDGEEILGGGGIAPLQDGPEGVCELRKMYLFSRIRGQGLGQKVMDLCLNAARELGYRQCYLETLMVMETAQALYRKNGFKECGPLGNTGHFSCDARFSRML